MKSGRWLSVAGLSVFAAAAVSGYAAGPAPGPTAVVSRAQQAVSNDSNIKKSAFDNASPRPPSKERASAKNRAARKCPVQVANDTGYHVEVFVNGNLEGTVGPWGSLSIDGFNAGITLYARAPQTSLAWGPQRVPFCPFTWTLSPPVK